MRAQFPLFQSHLDLAHAYWKRLVQPGDLVIDATCGNGQDTLILGQLALGHPNGKVLAMDIQSKAIELTRTYLSEKLGEGSKQVEFLLGCHSNFPVSVEKESVTLIVYNLGYLPGNNKNLTTLTATTLQSLRAALLLLKPGGAISLTCYPGHAEGAKEQEAILEFAASLSAQEWNCCHHRWLNRKQAPSLLFLQKAN